MDLVSSREVRHTDFGSKAESRDQFISIVIEDDVADFMECLLILALFAIADVVERLRLILEAIASCEIDADYHGHLHST